MSKKARLRKDKLLESVVTYFGQPVIRDLWLVLGSFRSSLGFSCPTPAPLHWRSVLLLESVLLFDLVSGADRFPGLEESVSCRVRDQSMRATSRDLRFAAVMLKNAQLQMVPRTHQGPEDDISIIFTALRVQHETYWSLRP